MNPGNIVLIVKHWDNCQFDWFLVKINILFGTKPNVLDILISTDLHVNQCVILSTCIMSILGYVVEYGSIEYYLDCIE